MEERQANIPSILNVNIKEARCLKDKIGPGYFLLKVKALNRIGGAQIYSSDFSSMYDRIADFKELSEALRDFSKKKRTFLNKENREEEVKQADGTVITKAAAATGLAFF